MTTRVLVISLDALDRRLVDRMMAEGDLPNLSALSNRGLRVDVIAECLSYLPGAIWFECNSGQGSWRTGQYAAFGQLHPGEAQFRISRPHEIPLQRHWFNMADAHGLRVALVDPCGSPHWEGFSGTTVNQYGIHELRWPMHVQPPELAQVVEEIGPYPVRGCDEMVAHGTDEERESIRKGVMEGADRKRAIAVEAVSSGEFDLAYVLLSEAHCIGHHMWHYMADDSPYAAEGTPELRAAVGEAARHLDTSVGELCAAAGDDAVVVVHLSHGMGHQLSGPQLIPPILERLEMGTGTPPLEKQRQAFPRPFRRFIKRLIPNRVINRYELDRRGLHTRSTRALALGNIQVGAVRLNLAGRDPWGSVEPDEADELIDRIEEALEELTYPDTDERIVSELVRTVDRWGPEAHPSLPDLLVLFRRDLGPIDACDSRGFGRIEVPLRPVHYWRTGDHTPDAAMFVAVPGQDLSGVQASGGNLDFAPTMLAALGIPVPPDLDGTPIPEVVAAMTGKVTPPVDF